VGETEWERQRGRGRVGEAEWERQNGRDRVGEAEGRGIGTLSMAHIFLIDRSELTLPNDQLKI
jgi:hypothetical protein